MAELKPTRLSTREPQYNRCLEVKEEIGLASLGLMTNQVWHDDPRRLTFILSRYKFVAKMLTGRRDVGEVGCGDAFGSRIVLQEVKKLTAYDFDPVFIEDVRRRKSAQWPIEACLHDMVADKLPKTPNRTDPGPLIFRVFTGGLSGIAICASAHQSLVIGTILVP